MIQRKNVILYPDNKRVILRPIAYSEENINRNVVARVVSLSSDEAKREVDNLFEKFDSRHQDFESYLKERFYDHSQYLFLDSHISEEKKLLIGAYFTQEYSFESAALFNPSIVRKSQNKDNVDKEASYIMSLRATGEGHISSVTFREVLIDDNINITVKDASQFAKMPQYIKSKTYDKQKLTEELFEKELLSKLTEELLKLLPDNFVLTELKTAVEQIKKKISIDKLSNNVLDGVILTALSNYEIKFSDDSHLSERIIFPHSPSEVNGIEDARFVSFKENDINEPKYYATYTAYDGSFVIPQMIETNDFIHFKVSTLSGDAVKNKGFALFPKKIKGRYAMLSRQDKENLFIMYSDNLSFWREKKLLIRPYASWEFSKVGNCGSPIETQEGWLVLTHGVGPLKQYAIGAILLDIENPEKVIGRLDEPLITPNEKERNGYVPNVVYTCGAVIHNDHLVIPYAFSDMATTFASVELKKLLAKLKK
jgi:predicted GH43/DUF377 family glycosyl hydrolase